MLPVRSGSTQVHPSAGGCGPQMSPKRHVPPHAGASDTVHVSPGATHRHTVVPACGSHVLPGGHGPPQIGAFPQVAGTVVEVEVAGVVVVLVVVAGAASVLV